MSFKYLSLIALSFAAYAGDSENAFQVYSTIDARVWVPDANGDLANAQHADRAIDVTARLVADPRKGNAGYEPEAGAHMRFLYVRNNRLLRVDVGAAAGINMITEDSKMWSLRGFADAELAKLFCSDAENCKVWGMHLNADVNLARIQGDIDDTPYLKITPLGGHMTGGYLFTKNNNTVIIKALGGGHIDMQSDFYPGTSKEMFASLGGAAEMHLGNKLMVLASVVQHFGLLDEENTLTEGKLKVRWRLLHQPIDRDDPDLIKDLSLIFEVNAYKGELRRARSYYYQKLVPVNTVTGNAGVTVGF